MDIRVERLSAEAFAPYGKVISRRGMRESADDFTWFGEMGTMRNGETQLNLCAMKVHAPVVKELETHAATREALVVLKGKGVVLAVAAPGALSEGDVRAFYVERGEGVIFEKNTFHSTPFPVDETAEMLIVFQKDTGANDLALHAVNSEMRIDFASIGDGSV